jgi:hypothetical protein
MVVSSCNKQSLSGLFHAAFASKQVSSTIITMAAGYLAAISCNSVHKRENRFAYPETAIWASHATAGLTCRRPGFFFDPDLEVVT